MSQYVNDLYPQAFMPARKHSAQAICAGEYSLVQHGSLVWLYHASGEGMQLSMAELAAMLKTHYDEHF